MDTRITMAVSPEKKKEIRATAKSKGMTITGYIMHLIEQDRKESK